MVKVTALIAEEKGGKAPFGSTRPSIGGGGGNRTVVLDALEGEEISYSEYVSYETLRNRIDRKTFDHFITLGCISVYTLILRMRFQYDNYVNHHAFLLSALYS